MLTTKMRFGIAAAALGATVVAFSLRPQAQARPLDVYWIDVEGGAATLIVSPAGQSILIDTGYPDDRGAPRIHKVATEVAKLTRIDNLIVTHFHNDHFGGAMRLAELMPVGTVFDNGKPVPPPSEKDAPIFAAYEKAFASRTLLEPGFELRLTQAKGAAPLSLRLLATRQAIVRPPSQPRLNTDQCKALTTDPPDSSDNANSTAWVLELGRFRFFDAGDLTWNTEAKLACPVDLVGKIDVYQVTHHGLAASNNDVLLRTIAPTVAVMNNGATKGTEARTVATLKSLPSLTGIYQLHKNVRPDMVNATADDHIANIDEQCAANYVRMRVQPDGSRYTIEIPARGHVRTYVSR